jgi:heme iron utilization protein
LDSTANRRRDILAHMNADHVDAMILVARPHGAIEATEATMTSVDRLGFSLKLNTKDGIKGTRINFFHEVATPQGHSRGSGGGGAASQRGRPIFRP